MILCITPNTAIDRTRIPAEVVPGEVRRAVKTIVAAGGNDLNTARTINFLGGDPLCMGFAGGQGGRLLEDPARNEGLCSLRTPVKTETRSRTILVRPHRDATVINEPGMPVTTSDWRCLRQDVQQQLDCCPLWEGVDSRRLYPSGFENLSQKLETIRRS
jgi:fructose-1-phosphate kinase PfkB-like protein